MIYESKKLTVSGIAGILVASLIILSIAMVPEPKSMAPLFKPPPGAPPLGSLMVNVFISNFTEPLVVGSEAILTIIITSKYDMSGVTARFDLLQVMNDWPIGISFIGGNLSAWNGDLKANISISFNTRVKTVEVGYARIMATATWWYDGWLGYEGEDSLWILILNDTIQVSYEPITPPGYDEAKPSNGTLPTWPNGTSWEP